MNKVVLIQCPKKFIEVVPIFVKECLKHGIFDKIYIVTDAKIANMDKCEIIHIEQDMQFASNILHALPFIKEELILLCCEDHIMIDSHSVAEFDKCFQYIEQHKNIGRLRLTHNAKVIFADGPADDGFRDLHHKYPYLVSLQPSIWRKGYLKYILAPGEDAWRTEIKGSSRARSGSFRNVCVIKTVFFATNFYKSGKYLRSQFADYAKANNIAINNPMEVFEKKNGCKKIIPFEEYNAS